MRSARFSRLAGTLLLLSIATAVEAQPKSEAEALRLLWAHARAHPDEVAGWQALLTQESMAAASRAAGEQPGDSPAAKAAREAIGEAASERVLAEWERLQPESAAPELHRLFRLGTGPERDRKILDLLDRYPADAFLLEWASRILRQAGENARATDLIENAIATHPEKAALWPLLHSLHQSQGNETLRLATLERWAEAVPGDGRMMALWVDQAPRTRLAGDLPGVAQRFLDSTWRASEDRLEACRKIAAAPALEPLRPGALDCLRRFESDRDEFHRFASRSRELLAALGAGESPPESADATLARIEAISDPEKRVGATLDLVRARNGELDCPGTVALFERLLGSLRSFGGRARGVAQAIEECAESPAAIRFVVGAAGRIRPEQLVELVNGFSLRVNGVRQGPLPAAQLAPVLEARLARDGLSAPLVRALDTVYTHLGQSERRLALFRQGRAAALPVSSLWEHDLIDLADSLSTAGDLGGATEVLDALVAERPTQESAARLWKALLRQGKLDAARALGVRLAASEQGEAAAVGALLQARAAAIDGDLDAAERLYAAAAENESHRDARRIEYLAFLDLTAGAEPARAAARRLCELGRLDATVGAVERCVGELLGKLGDGEAAARALVEAAKRAPDSAEAVAAVGRSSADPETALYALRFRVENDPENAEAWGELAHALAREGDASELEQLLARARAQFVAPPDPIVIAVARQRQRDGRARAAIDLLLEARERVALGGYTSHLDEELHAAYAALSAETF